MKKKDVESKIHDLMGDFMVDLCERSLKLGNKICICNPPDKLWTKHWKRFVKLF